MLPVILVHLWCIPNKLVLRKDTDIIHVAMGGGQKSFYTCWGRVQKVLAACEGGVKKVWWQQFLFTQPPHQSIYEHSLNTFFILMENFDRKSNNWGSLGVRSCKKGRHSVKKKDAEKGIYCQADGIYRPMGVCPPPPPSSWPNEVHTYLIPLSQFLSKEEIVFICLVTYNPYYNLTNPATGNHPTWKV